MQAWPGRKRHAHGHHSPSSIQGEWLAIDDQKITFWLHCLASYLAANWLQKLETKHCVYYAEVISVLMRVWLCDCVILCVCVWISVWFIYKKTKLPFCKMSVFCSIYLTLLCDVQISHYGTWLDDGGKHDKTTDGGN